MFSGPLILWTVVLGCFIFLKLSQQTRLAARLALLPGARALTSQLVTANSALVLKGGASAGMLYHQSLDMAAECCGNAVMGEAMRQQAKALMEGQTANLSAALAALNFPTDMQLIVRNAEETGTMEAGLGRVATLSHERFHERVTWSARIATGLLIFIAMLFAAYVIISTFVGVYIGPLQELSR